MRCSSICAGAAACVRLFTGYLSETINGGRSARMAWSREAQGTYSSALVGSALVDSAKTVFTDSFIHFVLPNSNFCLFVYLFVVFTVPAAPQVCEGVILEIRVCQRVIL